MGKRQLTKIPAMVERNFLVLTTSMFRDEQPDDELDQWFLGEDCSRWLEAKLLELEDVSVGVSPVEEDWHGWTFGIRAHGIWFWVNVWSWSPKTWVIGVQPKPGPLGFFRRERTKFAKQMLCEDLDSILAAAPEIDRHEWLKLHPADLPRLLVTDKNKVHIVAAPTYLNLEWQWRLYVPKQAKLRLFVASGAIPAADLPVNFRAKSLPSGNMLVRAQIRPSPLGKWKFRATWPSGLLAQEIPADRRDWLLDPDGYCERQAGLAGTESTDLAEPVVLLRLRANQKPDGGHDSVPHDVCDGVMVWLATDA